MPEVKDAKGKVTKWDHSRAERMRLQKIEPPMPEIEFGAYLIQALTEIGFSEYMEGGGEKPVSWQTIQAYAASTGTISDAWEMTLLRDLSRAYLEGKIEGRHPMSIPYSEREDAGW